MHYFNFSTQKTLDKLKTSTQGLSNQEAKNRLDEFGLNQLAVNKTPLWKIILEPFANVFNLILFIAAGLSFLQHEFFDGGVIILIMTINAIIFYAQTYSTQKILRTLSQKNSQKVEVLRDGQKVYVDAAHLVPGDIASLHEGDKVPADGRIIFESNLRVDESQLTGESVPVAKDVAEVKADAALFERTNMVYQGSFVIGGSGKFAVTETGGETEFGKIAKLVKKDELTSPIQRKIDKLISQIVAIVLALAAVCLGLALWRGMNFSEAIHFVLTLTVSAVPESLPIAISVVLVLGMRRMAKKHALVQTMRSIETIGAITTIATDKTGTLTFNKLHIEQTWQPESTQKIDLIESSLLSIPNLNQENESKDPLDIAIKNQKNVQIPAATPAGSVPFEQDFAMSGSIWHQGEELDFYVKGSPEAILRRSKISQTDEKQVFDQIDKFTKAGYRVIGFGRTKIKQNIESFTELPKSTKFEFIGLVAVADRIRPEAKKAVKSALAAGVSVRMITGDHKETAFFIGQKLDMVKNRNEVFDASNIDKYSDAELAKIINKTRIFARVTPEQKYRILQTLKKHNITAMTGDGVNDVPALSEANVGLAMGSGSQIAKDTGDIILLDDNFKTIIDALREGRSIIANVKRMLFYLLSTNLGEVLVMIISLLINLPLPLVPIQILWVNLATDSIMVIPLGLEPAEDDIMKKKPQNPKAALLSKRIIVRMLAMAGLMAGLVVGIFAYFVQVESTEYARTIAFHVLVVTQLAAALAARSELSSLVYRARVRSKSFNWAVIISIILHSVTLFTPLGTFLHIVPVSGLDLLSTGLIAFSAPLLASEIIKAFDRRKEIQK